MNSIMGPRIRSKSMSTPQGRKNRPPVSNYPISRYKLSDIAKCPQYVKPVLSVDSALLSRGAPTCDDNGYDVAMSNFRRRCGR